MLTLIALFSLTRRQLHINTLQKKLVEEMELLAAVECLTMSVGDGVFGACAATKFVAKHEVVWSVGFVPVTVKTFWTTVGTMIFTYVIPMVMKLV
eukprot:NODE_521_length_1501_cov_188.085754.p6 GENE.NODE_521_length_1501_cov_188.085754~~NODE_521_length_1501_cov_188.085754.p6  ORF type:complete len:95 (-),score=22.60 NODE_521_length_1501_cov_188.085754:439-723(-)